MPTLSTKRTMVRANEPAAKRLRTLEQAVRRNTAELKFREGTSSVVAGIADLTKFIPQGTARDQRVGDIINIKKVEVRMLGNGGVNRYRMVLYTPNDQTTTKIPLELGDNFPSFIDTEQYKVWQDNMDTSRQWTTPTIGNLPGQMPNVKKTFSIPMKCKWRKAETDPYHNPVLVEVGVQSSTATIVQPPADYAEFQYKIWYYDA